MKTIDFASGKKVTVAMIEKGQVFNLLRTFKHEYTVVEMAKKGNKFSRYATHVELKRDKEETTNFVPIQDFVDMLNKEVVAAGKERGEAVDAKKKGKKKVDVHISERETTERLPRKLTDPELIAAGHEAAETLSLIDSTEDEAAGVAKSFKSKIGELEARLKTLSAKLHTREIWEPVAVRIVYNWTDNVRSTVRKDTGELVRETAIPVEDRQTFFTDPGEKEKRAESEAESKKKSEAKAPVPSIPEEDKGK